MVLKIRKEQYQDWRISPSQYSSLFPIPKSIFVFFFFFPPIPRQQIQNFARLLCRQISGKYVAVLFKVEISFSFQSQSLVFGSCSFVRCEGSTVVVYISCTPIGSNLGLAWLNVMWTVLPDILKLLARYSNCVATSKCMTSHHSSHPPPHKKKNL